MSKSELHKEIIDLKNEVLRMGDLAYNMLENSIKALNKYDLELAKTVIKNKHQLRDFDSKIEDKSLKLIALYQPMAIDLRTLACILKVITYLARIGRYGKDIADVVRRHLSEKNEIKVLVNLQHIFEHVRDMIILSLESFNKGDIELIKDFSERDSEVDELRWAVYRECIAIMMENPRCITPCHHFITFARYLERCGDHACKIAEKVYYMVTGKHIEIK